MYVLSNVLWYYTHESIICVKVWSWHTYEMHSVFFGKTGVTPDSRVSLILGWPFLSTANAHINVGGREITFEIDGKEEKFAFKPRPEHNINANMIDQEKTSLEGPLSSKTEDAPEY
jgi:hypothetical protein